MATAFLLQFKAGSKVSQGFGLNPAVEIRFHPDVY